MKVIVALISFCFVFLNQSYSQICNYYDTTYQVRVEADILYGIDTLFNGQPDSLFVDIYKPIGDEKEFRPVMIWVYGGGFFAGTRKDMASLATVWAKRGYVSAAIDYRLGFTTPIIFSYPFSAEPAEVIRAGYRATQDAKGAIRFLKARHVQDSSDLGNFFIGGFSAGSITSLGSQFLDDAAEKPAEAGVLSDIGTFPPLSRPDLGPHTGRLNLNNGYDAKCKGVLNFYGAVSDLAIISGQEDFSLFSYHQTNDPIVPCGNASFYHTAGFGIAGGYPDAFGTCVMRTHLDQIGFVQDTSFYVHQGGDHSVHDPSAMIYARSGAWLQEQICGYITTGSHINSASNDYRITPNPSSTDFVIQSEKEINFRGCYDVTGKNIQLDLTHYGINHVTIRWPEATSSGMYFLDLGDQVLKLVKAN